MSLYQVPKRKIKRNDPLPKGPARHNPLSQEFKEVLLDQENKDEIKTPPAKQGGEPGLKAHSGPSVKPGTKHGYKSITEHGPKPGPKSGMKPSAKLQSKCFGKHGPKSDEI